MRRPAINEGYGQPPEGWEVHDMTTPAVHETVEDAAAYAAQLVEDAEAEGYYVEETFPAVEPETGLYGVYIRWWRPPVGMQQSDVDRTQSTMIDGRDRGEKKGWPWYAYAGIGLGVVAVIGMGYAIYKGSK